MGAVSTLDADPALLRDVRIVAGVLIRPIVGLFLTGTRRCLLLRPIQSIEDCKHVTFRVHMTDAASPFLL